MSFMPCMFLVNELGHFDSDEFISYWYRRSKPQPVVIFKQPSVALSCVQQTYSMHYDSFSLPSVLPVMSLISHDGSASIYLAP